MQGAIKMNSLTILRKHLKLLVLILSLSMLTACGGGDEDVAGTEGDGGIIGTAKIIVKSTDEVKAKSKSGNSYKAKIASTGQYHFKNLKSDSYLLKTKSGNTDLYSIAYFTKGKSARSNIHSITDLIIRNWFKQQGKDIDAEFKGSSPISKMPSIDEINAIETAIQGILSQVLKESGVKESVNLVSQLFELKADDKFNQFLDKNQVVINDNKITMIFTGDTVQTISIGSKDINTDFVNDKEKPTAPTNLRALPAGTHEIVIVWEPSTDDRGVAGYNVYRNGTLIATTPYPVYTDKKGLSSGVNYDYAVEAIDGAKNKSGQAFSQSVTTLSNPDTTPPPAISNLSATVNQDDVDMRWDLSQINDIARFIIKRGLQGMAKSELASITANTFADFNLADGDYCYTVTAVDAANNSSPESAEQCASINTGGTNPPPTTISCSSYTALLTTSINEDTTISAGCYTVDENIKVNNPAKLTISPNVLLQFKAGTKIEVGSGASMTAVGTRTKPIIFTAKDKTPGYWKGVLFYRSNSVNNKLDYVTIEYGEINIDTVSFSSDPTRLNVSNSTSRYASNLGMYIYDNSVKLDSFKNNTLTHNARPILLPAGMVGSLDKSSIFTGNEDDRIHVYDQTISTPQTWKKLDAPYYMSELNSTYNVNAGLTLEAGVKLIFNSGSKLEVGSAGSLKAVGTSSSPIVLTGFEKTAGYWKGLLFYRSNTTNNQLDYVTIEYGVKNIDTVSFSSDPTRFSIKNSIIRHASNDGIFIYDSSVKLGAFENNQLTANARPISLPPNIVKELDSNSTFTGNEDDSIHIQDQSLSIVSSWKRLDVPYYFEDSSRYDINAGLTIAAGSKLIFYSGAGLNINSNGYLNAIGNSTNKIIFTGSELTQGYWKGIHFYRSNKASNILENTVIEYGGDGTANSGAVSSVCFPSDPSRFTIKNSMIRESLGWGVYKFDDNAYGCKITLKNNIYSNNLLGGVNTP